MTLDPATLDPAPADIDPASAGPLRRAGRAVREFAHILTADAYGRVGMGLLLFFIVVAVIAPLVAPMDPWLNNYRPDGGLARLESISAHHWLGTTFYGQDVFSQLVLGTRQTILVGFITAFLIGFIGTNVGLISGYFGGIVDEILMRITDFFYAIPFLPFMMVVVALIDRSLPVIIASMAFIFWRTAARVVRAQVLTLKTRPYVLAARASGAGHLRIMYVHILPNVLPLGFLYLIFGAAWAILTESSLSFIGLGDPNQLSWGLMLNQAFATGSIRHAWWWVVPPGAALMAFLVGLYFLGRGFEERANPRLREQR
ncbi:MAG: ABC transporter permease [Xanthobacteraceae bacterium]